MKDTITTELSNALKNGDKERIHTLRLVLAAIKDKEIASRSSGEDSEISEEVVIQLLKKMVKQRNDSIEMFEKAGRTELVEKEKLEIKIINEFLPKQLSEEETATICAISHNKEFLGGNIIPGLNLSMRALEEKTAQLPSVEIVSAKTAIGRSTVESIQAGLYWSNVGLSLIHI